MSIGSLEKKVMFSTFPLKLVNKVFTKVWILHSCDSFLLEVHSNLISKSPNSKSFPLQMGFLLNLKLMIDYNELWLIMAN